MTQTIKNLPSMRGPQFDAWVGKIPWRRNRLFTPVFLGFPGGTEGKESACNAGDLGLIPGLERSPEEGHDNPLQYSGLANSVDRGARWLQSMESQRVGHVVLFSLNYLRMVSKVVSQIF